MNLETNIKDVIAKKLEDGTVEKLVEENLQRGVSKALESLFSSYGDVTKVIEEQVKSVMIPYLESYDYSKYITKLDSVLVDVLKCSSLENKKLLENFKHLMTSDDRKEIKVTDLFEEWKEYVRKNVETDGLEIDFDDRPTYEYVEVSMNVSYDDERSWSSFDYATLVFECEHDEKMNFAIRLSKWDKRENWDIRYDSKQDISSLRYLNEFEITLMKLDQNGVKLILDSDYENDEVEPEKEPEVTFS
ncbi:hypothetical protein ACQKCU_23965 [Heyndrickxia sporothermodurans]